MGGDLLSWKRNVARVRRNVMLRVLLTFVVVVVALLLALGLLGLAVGPYETALVLALAVIAAVVSGRRRRKRTTA